jgi:hypothetical protein
MVIGIKGQSKSQLKGIGHKSILADKRNSTICSYITLDFTAGLHSYILKMIAKISAEALTTIYEI